MSITTFDDVFRAALWQVYKNRCFYCTEPLDWSSYQIDHIVPEWLKDDPEKLAELIQEFGLDSDFDLNVSYNLVPAHIQCNNRKSGKIFEKSTTLYFVQLSKEKQKVLSKEIESIRNKKNKGTIFAKVQAALANGLISHNEMAQLLKTAKENQWSAKSVELPHEIDYIEGVIQTFYLNGDYYWLANKAIPDNEIDMINDKGDQQSPKSLKEFNKAIEDGYYPKTNADIRNASGFTFLASFLKALTKAAISQISFVEEPRITLLNLECLSPTLLMDMEDNLKPYIEKGCSVQDLIDEGLVKVKDPFQYEVCLEYDNFEVSLREHFRADFNNDGIEDIFVQTWTNAVGGSLGFGDTIILTRYSNKHLLELAK